MAESSRRFRNSTSRSIAATSAIALALGGLSVVGPGPLAPYAAASDYTGGIRDKSGAVEEDAQQASDLPAGSCVVKSDEPNGSQAGFSWNNLEPGTTSDDKTLWGLSVSFDNSKDRTFADWYFSNSGSLGSVLNTGDVPSMEAGQTFDGKSVTHKADENIDITTSGRGVLRNLNLYAELTDEKVKQFASASAADPVRYAWQSNYKQDNDKGSAKATEGGSASFGATVNPWPSENIECNPITVSWEESQRFVVNPGNENKVGHINVPELLGEGGGTDDSLSRMVVEAYDEDGNLIGTSDAKASGGEQNLRIDDNGDIFFTWPKYVDSDHATDKNVNFSVFAQPRSVNELQAAAEHNNGGIGAAFNASNSLDRYSKANVVDSGGVALDSTDLHNPKYDENEKHITSEVGENGTGEDEGRHVVTFTPVVDAEGNTLQDLVDKFNATVELDEVASNIFDGWDATLNEDYTVTVKSPGGKDTRPGTFAQPFVKVIYSNGSTDLIPLLVVVDPNNTQVTDVKYPRVTDMGEAGKQMTVTGTPTRILGKGKPVLPATYEIVDKPDGWDVTVADDGTITAIPPVDAKPGDFASVDLKVTYPDGTVDTPSTTFVVGERKKNQDAEPSFPEKTVYPDEETTSPLTVEKPEDVEFAAQDPFVIDPEATEGFIPTGDVNDFGNPIYKVPTENGDWYVSLDDNGDVVTKIPATAKPGDAVNVPVKVTYSDGSSDIAEAPIVVVDNKREVPFEIEYKFDPNLPAGEYDVREKGVPGEEVLLRDETWNRTKDPINEVVYIGTKPPEASEDVKWTVPIPFPTEVRENLDLAPGETKVVQEGENGEKTYTAKFTAKGDQAQVAEEETNKEPVKRIIEVGPRLDAQELVTKTDKPIPFTTKVVFDDTLAQGEQVVDQPGELGNEVSTSTQKLVDGKPSGDPVVTTERTKEPTEQIIRVGTKTTGENTESVESEIPFGVRVEFDPNMPAGTSETVTEGKPGKKTVTITRDVTNSAPGAPTISEEVIDEPVDQVIKVGTKPSEASENVTWTAQVPFEVETRPNPELKPGEIKVAQKGVPGEKTYTADFSATGDQATVTPEEKQTKAPVKEIIEYGPAAEDTAVVTKTEKPVPFETEIVFDDTLAAGEQVVDTQGEYGTEVVTSTQKLVDGKPSGDPVVTTERTKEPTNAVIRVGSKTSDTPAPAPEVSETVALPYTTKIVFDPTLEPGQEIEDVKGVDGEVKVSFVDGKASAETVKEPVQRVVRVGSKPGATTEWTEETPFEVKVVVDPELEAGKYETVQEGKPGQIVHRTDGTEDITPAVDHIIKVGTKKVITNPFEFTTVQPYSTTVRPNFDLQPGERKVVQEGVNGFVRFKIDITTGEVDKLEESREIERIVEYGPAKTDDEAVTKVTRPVPFDTEIVEDPNLPEGVQTFEQGEVGEEIVTTTQPIKDGKPYGDPVTTTEQTKAPRNAIIRVGTKKPDAPQPLPEFSETVELPYTTKIVWDPTLEPGQEIEDVAGANGLVEARVADGKLTLETVKKPVQRVVRVGSKPADDVEWTEEIPFQVQVRQNPELTRGETRVVQDGVPGLKRYVNGKGEVVTEPVDYIFEIGTEDLTEQPAYSAVALRAGQSAEVALSTGHVKGNAYRKLDWPEGWEGSVDPETGQIRVTPPADAKPGMKVSLPVEVTDANGNTFTVNAEVAVFDNGAVTPTPTPEDDKASSDKARRCLANAFAANSPFLWLLPLGILGAVGYGVNEAFGPQIQQISAQFDEAVRRNTPDFGVGHGVEKPEFVREIEGQVNAINQRFAPVAEQLQPVGIALGAIALLSLTGVLVAQACSEDGFDNGLTVLGSSKDDNTAEAARSSKK